MDFDTLHATVPYVTDGKLKSIKVYPYDGITLALPGRHADQTSPPGGDFVVMVTDPLLGWDEHQFTHGDIFVDLSNKSFDLPNATCDLMKMYCDVILGADPETVEAEFTEGIFEGRGVDPHLFLRAVQCLAVAEHRRYARYENMFGGRFLPFRFAAGIVEDLWTDAQAIEVQKKGRPGVERLERENGVPKLTRKLVRLSE